MSAGDVYFDRAFQFHDGEIGEKLIVILGSEKSTTLVCKTTSQNYGKGITYGCQNSDRIPNFYLPLNSCYLKKPTWICLTEQITRELQDCALNSDDITPRQERIIRACRV
ncbi:MAG: hypothetical protein IBX50_13555 [Marinospirillum sp.]|uniref:hypothetical protein n=1 Tax=Marinospirillum sp. TaxID=2183934 RepID=UPI0019E0DEBC|nr:hypothetical protein [Marinospirillum sp.]MBE0507713.1 hypothetical protein [Marinospirillum sp.]